MNNRMNYIKNKNRKHTNAGKLVSQVYFESRQWAAQQIYIVFSGAKSAKMF